jgi:pyruvate/2-oxoglutarate/acetoin dehydrogenase E1 component
VKNIRYVQAINEALFEEMQRDPKVFVLGEDVRHALMGTTTGLVEEFGEKRVIDTPISEAGFTGMAIGAAMSGLRPVVEYEINTLQFVAMDQLVNQMGRLRYMVGGQVNLPITVRVVGSGSSGFAAQHSESGWAQLVHVGLKVVVPSTPYDAKGLLKSAIREDDPVIVYEPVQLYGVRGEVPEEDYTIPLGVADVKKEGNDVTIVAVGHLVAQALDAASQLEKMGISIEVVDPRTLYPLDKQTILQSVAKTGRLVVADDGYRFCSMASEIAATVAEEGFSFLKAPIRRITRPMVPVPHSIPLLQEVSPSATHITQTVGSLLGVAR